MIPGSMSASSQARIPLRALALLFALLSAGCVSLPERYPVPLWEQDSAQVLPGVAGVRAWSGSFSEEFRADLLLATAQARALEGQAADAPISVLAISGGSDRGAFGAGFLNGWSQFGTRPRFRIVTGISAGALSAPFAFLGPGRDDELEEAFTRTGPEDIYRARGVQALWSDSLADSAPLQRLIDQYFDEEFLAAVARAHEQGRRLYVGTTNLDADRLVVWNMGAIAASEHPYAPELFRRVVLASSSVPGVFPPVMIRAMVNGEPRDEMHVDGGVKAQVFLTAATVDLTRLRREVREIEGEMPRTRLYVIRNGEVGPEPKITERNVRDITVRAFDTLIKSQARSDLARIHDVAKAQDFDFNWVAIPSWFEPSGRFFDTGEMNRLFGIGFRMALEGPPWRKTPPAFDRP